MDNSIITSFIEVVVACLLAFPLIMLGMWLSSKRWFFYPIVVVGFAWMTWIIFGLVGELCMRPGVTVFVEVTAWTIPPIFFVVLNVGAVCAIQGARRLSTEKSIVGKVLS